MTRKRIGIVKQLLGILVLTAGIGMPAFALGDYIGIEPQYWSQSMDGTVRADGSVQGTKVDLHDDLGLDRTDNLPAGRVWLHWLKRHYLIATHYDSSRSGETILTSPVIFDDKVFLPGERLRTRLQTELSSLVYGYNFLDLKVVKLGFRLGADRLSFEGDLDSATSGTTAGVREEKTFPVVGLGISAEPIPLLRFTGEISGVSARANGDKVIFADARAQAELYINHFIGFHGGYRQVRTDVDLKDFGTGKVTQKGPYAGITIRF